jgi:hypothetical protein
LIEPYQLYARVTPFSGLYTFDTSVKPPSCELQQSLVMRGTAALDYQTRIPLYDRELFAGSDNLVRTDERRVRINRIRPGCGEYGWCTRTSGEEVCSLWEPTVNSEVFRSRARLDCSQDPGCTNNDCQTCYDSLCEGITPQGVIGCELQPERCEYDDDCPQWDMCAFRQQCIRRTPLRVSVTWAAPVDLELYAFDQHDEQLHELTGAAYNDAPDGWIAARSSGDGVMGPPYFETAVYSFAGEGEVLRFYVENLGGDTELERIPYTVRLEHEADAAAGFDGLARQFEGTIDARTSATSIMYVYTNPAKVRHCYKIDPEVDRQSVCPAVR